MKKRCARSFSLEKDGFIGELYTGTRAPGKAILYVGRAGCKRKMTLMMGQYLADAAEKRMMAVLKETGFQHNAELKLAYKYLLTADPALAEQVGNKLLLAFSLPVWIVLVFFWLPMLVIQFKAFAKGLTPYPGYAKWFNLFVGGIPALVISMFIGSSNPWGPAIGTMFLSFGNAFTFGGLLATLPKEELFEEFRNKLAEVH